MNTSILRIGPAAIIGALLLTPALFATSITVNNASFETLPAAGLPFGCGTNCSFSVDNIPGWAVTGTTGQFQPGPPATTTYFDSVPDGVTVAYTNGGTITQTVVPVVQLGVIYTLMVEVGVRHDIGDPGTEALIVNGVPYFATGTLAAPGGWSTFTATYTGLAADVGQSITIQLASNGSQGDWDNVRLSDSTGGGPGVPEPVSSAMVGIGVLAVAGGMRRRRT